MKGKKTVGNWGWQRKEGGLEAVAGGVVAGDEGFKDAPIIVVLNKCDLVDGGAEALDEIADGVEEVVSDALGAEDVHAQWISCETGEGTDDLLEVLDETVQELVAVTDDSPAITRARHRSVFSATHAWTTSKTVRVDDDETHRANQFKQIGGMSIARHDAVSCATRATLACLLGCRFIGKRAAWLINLFDGRELLERCASALRRFRSSKFPVDVQVGCRCEKSSHHVVGGGGSGGVVLDDDSVVVDDDDDDDDMQAEELGLAMEAVGEIYGDADMEEMLDVVFRDFCIGK